MSKWECKCGMEIGESLPYLCKCGRWWRESRDWVRKPVLGGWWVKDKKTKEDERREKKKEKKWR